MLSDKKYYLGPIKFLLKDYGNQFYKIFYPITYLIDIYIPFTSDELDYAIALENEIKEYKCLLSDGDSVERYSTKIIDIKHIKDQDNDIKLLKSNNKDVDYLFLIRENKAQLFEAERKSKEKAIEIIKNNNIEFKKYSKYDESITTTTTNTVSPNINLNVKLSGKSQLDSLYYYGQLISGKINLSTYFEKVLDPSKSVNKEPYKPVKTKIETEKEIIEEKEKEEGQKWSNDKLPVHTVIFKQFPDALKEVIICSQAGHKKYPNDIDWMNFKRVPDAENQYMNAAIRHMLENGYNEDMIKYGNIRHDAQVIWNLLAALQIRLMEEKKKRKEWNQVRMKLKE